MNRDVTLTLVNLAVTGGYDILVGTINNAGTLNVTNTTFSDNNSVGAILNTGGSLNVTNSTFSHNSGRAILNTGGTLNVANSTFSSNSGGAIYNDGGTVTVTGSTFYNAIYNAGAGQLNVAQQILSK